MRVYVRLALVFNYNLVTLMKKEIFKKFKVIVIIIALFHVYYITTILLDP